MKHIFICHAGADSAIANQLAGDLRNAGTDVRIDCDELKLGDDSFDFMNEGILDAYAVVALYSKHTTDAVFQKLELKGALWHEVVQAGGKVIILRIDNSPILPLYGPKVFGYIDDDRYNDTVKRLCADIIPQTTPTSLVCKALAQNSKNPFWRVRAEYYEDLPKLLADAYSTPVLAKLNVLEELLPCFLEGSRGTGKTMLLLSLRARTLASRIDTKTTIAELFGFYVRLDRGAFSNAGLASNKAEFHNLTDPVSRQLADVFSQEFYLCAIESVIAEIAHCMKMGYLVISEAEERTLASLLINDIAEDTPSSSIRSIVDLSDTLRLLHRRLTDFIRRKFIYGESPPVPFTHCDRSLLCSVFSIMKRQVVQLQHSQMTMLLDEYENLHDFQKQIVNTAVKFGPPSFSTKIARKIGTIETSSTTVSQDLQESHDFNRISLIYSVEDPGEFVRYQRLLREIVRRQLPDCSANAEEMLPHDPTPEVPEAELLEEICKLHRIDLSTLNDLPERERADKITCYKEAAVYRILYNRRGRRTLKRFSGFREMAFISSGVIRFFQEIIGLAYYLQSNDPDAEQLFPIAPKHQSEAVHIVSDHNVAMLSRNVEVYGEKLKYLLLDLGDCLRQKLFKHTSEPEAGRITISDPSTLSSTNYSDVVQVINAAVRDGVFQQNLDLVGFRPKHVEDVQPLELNLSRIFAPSLRISPRLRWRTSFASSDILGLLDDNRRRKTKGAIVRRLVKKSKIDESSKGLFSPEDVI